MKKVLLIVSCLALIFLSNGCGRNVEQVSGDNTGIEYKANNNKKNKPIKLTENQLTEIPDLCEITILDYKISSEIIPPNSKQFFTFYSAQDDSTKYLDISTQIKNMMPKSSNINNFAKVHILYDEKYEYQCFCIMENKEGTDFEPTGSIDPLFKAKLHYLAKVPMEVELSNKSLKAVFLVEDKEYVYILR